MKETTTPLGRQTEITGLPPFPLHVFVRFLAAYVLGIGVFFLLQSPVLESILGGTLLVPGELDAFVLVLPALAIGFLCHAVRADLSVPWPRPLQIGLAFGLLAVTMVLSYAVTHYTHDALAAIAAALEQVPSFLHIGLYALAMTLYVVLLLPMAVTPFLFVPWVILRTIRPPLLMLVALVVTYLYASIAEYVFHVVAAPVTLFLATRVLLIFSGDVVSLPDHWRLGYRSFFVNYGPACSGFTAIILILAAFFYLRARARARPPLLSFPVIVAVILPFLVLIPINALRIAAIMMIGASSPALAIWLFHSIIGTVLFLAVFAGYLRMIVPWALGSGHAKGRQG